jgi:DNA-binding winged helix-turn-helix (wHTH) protein
MSSKHIAIVRRQNGGLFAGNEIQRRPCVLSSTGVYKFGPFELDTPERRLPRDGVQVPLRLKAFETLRMLVENAGRLVTKEALLRQVWPDAMVEENNINANVSILRKALGEDANGQSYIETVPRVGYRFVAPVAQMSSPQSAPTTSGDAAPELEPEKSVAVLYFENLSGDKEDEYFRDGMTEDVITELATIKDLRLFPRSAGACLPGQTAGSHRGRPAVTCRVRARRECPSSGQPSSHHRPARGNPHRSLCVGGAL